MYKFYEQNIYGGRGELIGECEPSDDFYFDFFRLVGHDKAVIMQSEVYGRVYSSLLIKPQYKAPPLKDDGTLDFCTGCENYHEACDCYEKWERGDTIELCQEPKEAKTSQTNKKPQS